MNRLLLLVLMGVVMMGCSRVKQVEFFNEMALSDLGWKGTKENLLDLKLDYIRSNYKNTGKKLQLIDVECAGNIVDTCPQRTCGGCWERDWDDIRNGGNGNVLTVVLK